MSVITPSAGFRWIRTATILVLLASVSLKLYHGLTLVVQPEGLLTSQPALAALIALEAGLFAWLVCACYPVWMRWTCLVVFFGFAVVALRTHQLGFASCGCFGGVRIPPLATAALDIVLALGWWWAKPPDPVPRTHPWLALAVMVGVLPLATRVALHEPVLPAPSTPSLSSTAPGLLRDGTWMVLAYRNDCPHCQAEFATWADAIRRGHRRHDMRWACVEVGPHFVAQGLFAEAGLTAEIALHLHEPGLEVPETPMALRVVDGRIDASFRNPWEVE